MTTVAKAVPSTNGAARAVPGPIQGAIQAIKELPPMPLLDAPLGGSLEGHALTLDEGAITFGFLEGLASNQPGPLMEALAGVIVGGSLFDLPPEAATDPEARREAIRVGLRKLHVRQIAPLLDGIRLAVSQVPKGS